MLSVTDFKNKNSTQVKDDTKLSLEESRQVIVAQEQ